MNKVSTLIQTAGCKITSGDTRYNIGRFDALSRLKFDIGNLKASFTPDTI